MKKATYTIVIGLVCLIFGWYGHKYLSSGPSAPGATQLLLASQQAKNSADQLEILCPYIDPGFRQQCVSLKSDTEKQARILKAMADLF